MNKPTAFSLPTEMVLRIDEYREGKDLSRSYVVRRAVDNYLSEKVEDVKVNKNENKQSEK